MLSSLQDKFLIGSKQVGIANNRDTDFLVIGDRNIRYINEQGEDILERTESSLRCQMELNSPSINNLLAYQLDRDFIGPDFPIEYHILDHKEKLIKILKSYAKDFRGYSLLVNCPKWMYHLLVNAFICMNNSTQLTEDQFKMVQFFHDGAPIEWLGYVKSLLLLL